MTPTPRETAEALDEVLGDTGWEAVGLAQAYLRIQADGGRPSKRAAQLIYRNSNEHLQADGERIVIEMAASGEQYDFLQHAKERSQTGSAGNFIPKGFPGAITERRFLERLEDLQEQRPSIEVQDDRHERHGLSDFTLVEGDFELPINVKAATTPFEKAKEFVGIESDDCLPIPAYKAHGALEKLPDLIYTISPDWELLDILPELLEEVFTDKESIVWEVMAKHGGSGRQNAEDTFIYQTLDKHWSDISSAIDDNPFHAISAKRAIRILKDKPKRTPGVGVKAWGTLAMAETNVHISISEETVAWQEVADRLEEVGVEGVLQDLRRTTEVEIPDPAF